MHSVDPVTVCLGWNAVCPFRNHTHTELSEQFESVFYKALRDPFISIVKMFKKKYLEKRAIYEMYVVQIPIVDTSSKWS